MGSACPAPLFSQTFNHLDRDSRPCLCLISLNSYIPPPFGGLGKGVGVERVPLLLVRDTAQDCAACDDPEKMQAKETTQHDGEVSLKVEGVKKNPEILRVRDQGH